MLAFLLAGATLTALQEWGLEPAVGVSSGPATAHLLAAGGAALLVFAIGFRLLPRLLVVSPSRRLVAVVLPAGAAEPALLAIDLHGGWLFRLGATLEALALVGFGLAYADTFRRSEPGRRRSNCCRRCRYTRRRTRTRVIGALEGVSSLVTGTIFVERAT